ncbi:MAG: FeoA family protein [Chloroflexota bacterium]|nr:MAG: hypothetical protein KatS3mg047_0702 [Bellilinea sp.]
MFHHRKRQRCARGYETNDHCLALCQVVPGREVVIRELERLHPPFRGHLQSYGLIPGRCVRVISQTPVTVIQVEQMELAFEKSVAEGILVEPVND